MSFTPKDFHVSPEVGPEMCVKSLSQGQSCEGAYVLTALVLGDTPE